MKSFFFKRKSGSVLYKCCIYTNVATTTVWKIVKNVFFHQINLRYTKAYKHKKWQKNIIQYNIGNVFMLNIYKWKFKTFFSNVSRFLT